MARRTWTDKSIAALKPHAKRYAVADPRLPGHYVRVTPNGVKSFYAVTRDPRGKQKWRCIGSTTLYTVEQSRERARDSIKAVRAGEDSSGPQTFEAVAEQWIKRHV